MMHWVYLTLAILIPGGFVVYVIGMWLVGMGWRDLRDILTNADATPLVYDGKEPFEQWATKMERARQIQAKEDARGD